MITYKQIEPDCIQTSETHADGSFTSGLLRRHAKKVREVADGTHEVKVGTKQVQTGTTEVLIRTDEVCTGSEQFEIGTQEGVLGTEMLYDTRPTYVSTEVYETEPTYEAQDVFETHTKFKTEEYSPWDELDSTLVEWLPATWEDEQLALGLLTDFKHSRQTAMDVAVVAVNGYLFDADEKSISRMANAVLAARDEPDNFVMQWSLSNTATGVMTYITLADLVGAHKAAVIHMSNVWSV